ncbi:hypothetical protein V6N12_065487 [Hibiscus sabdariffa]|uniref:Uncharacterized protein n=1 Tax=Hibiscus sabdariffa TaxID=183260 RepID=A0ABR2G8V5_9ROSI
MLHLLLHKCFDKLLKQDDKGDVSNRDNGSYPGGYLGWFDAFLVQWCLEKYADHIAIPVVFSLPAAACIALVITVSSDGVVPSLSFGRLLLGLFWAGGTVAEDDPFGRRFPSASWCMLLCSRGLSRSKISSSDRCSCSVFPAPSDGSAGVVGWAVAGAGCSVGGGVEKKAAADGNWKQRKLIRDVQNTFVSSMCWSCRASILCSWLLSWRMWMGVASSDWAGGGGGGGVGADPIGEGGVDCLLSCVAGVAAGVGALLVAWSTGGVAAGWPRSSACWRNRLWLF